MSDDKKPEEGNKTWLQKLNMIMTTIFILVAIAGAYLISVGNAKNSAAQTQADAAQAPQGESAEQAPATDAPAQDNTPVSNKQLNF